MEQSLLEMVKELVVMQIKAHRLELGEVLRLLERTHDNLMMLRRSEVTGVVGREVPREPVDWRRSITRQTVTCLECRERFKQLSGRHLQKHGLDGRSYRAKYGIPRTQALMARDIAAQRRRVIQRVRPWEKKAGS
jgi:predicted transcriptional regulator